MHEPLTGRRDERHRLGEEHAHGVAERDRLLVRPAADLDLLERRRSQLDGGVEGERRELLALRDAMRVLFPEAVALVSAARQGFMREG